MNKKYLTIGTLWKQEDSYALDFLKMHRRVGVERFCIFDREFNSLPKLLKNEPDVEIIHFPDIEGNDHQEAWGQLIKLNQGKSFWLGLIDADQVIIPVQTDDIKTVLKNYEDYACLQLNWKAFGSSGHATRLPGSIYERFTMTCQAQNQYNYHTQFICQPDRTLGTRSVEPHFPHLPPGEIQINTDKQPIDPNKIVALNPSTPLSFNVPALHDVMYCNHYTNKSKEEWLIKNAKGRADIFGVSMPTDQFDQYEAECNEMPDTRAAELWNSIERLDI